MFAYGPVFGPRFASFKAILQIWWSKKVIQKSVTDGRTDEQRGVLRVVQGSSLGCPKVIPGITFAPKINARDDP